MPYITGKEWLFLVWFAGNVLYAALLFVWNKSNSTGVTLDMILYISYINNEYGFQIHIINYIAKRILINTDSS